MVAVAVSVQLSSYKATVHYESCKMYSSLYHHSKLPIPSSIKWRLCHWCKPSAEDIVTIAEEITWQHRTAEAMNLQAGMLLPLSEDVEMRMTRQALNGDGVVTDRLR